MRKKLVILSALSIASVMSLTGCRGIETTYTRNTLAEAATMEVIAKDGTITKTTLPKGTVMEVTKRTADESLLTDQILADSGSVQALRIKPVTGDSSSPTAEVVLGGANHAFTKSPVNEDRPICAYSKSTSIFGAITSASAGGISWVYVGVKGESAADTAARIAALKTLSEDSSTTK